MNLLQKFSKDLLLRVNVEKTKTVLVYTEISLPHSNVFYESNKIEIVTSFKCLGVNIRIKLEWNSFIS